jgi:alpha-glucan, water dikinase
MNTGQTITTQSGLTLQVETRAEAGEYEVSFQVPAGPRCLLHWGVRRPAQKEWRVPPQSAWPSGTQPAGASAVQTPFSSQNSHARVVIRLAATPVYASLDFVLFFPDEGRWDNNHGRNYQILLAAPAELGTAELAGLADEIVRAETAHNSWTLMHRFNLCHDLLDRVGGQVDGQALLYVWLRFSAIRQLTWQRNYNTKPRELAHAQDRLTRKLAEVYRAEPASRPLARLVLATVGRGGEGQRIRDEILNIMHRHHVKEVGGHFLEEWHQKLHNNTTPDDVVICEAYLEFLRSHGHLDRFYQTLQEGGVTRQRLESFERPIRSSPHFVPELKEGLIRDFQGFLKILKASHSGTDLETAIQAARSQLDAELQGVLSQVWEHRDDPPDGLVELVSRITDARRRLSSLLRRSDGWRELLYLDLALEQTLRGAVERNIHLRLDGHRLADLIARVLENVTLSYEDPELAICSRQWDRLQTRPRFGAEWSLHAKSVADRIARALSAWIDRFYQLLQPKAEYLGRGFQVETWTITLFSEEVVRGSSLGFVLSMLLHHLDPLLRQAARLGTWQIISRGRGAGRVEVVRSLRAIQRVRYDRPTVIVADEVMGDEEIPEGVTAVLAPDVTDIVSHVAVRARNANVLFASCHDAELLQRLKSMQGRHLQLAVNPAGDVIVEESAPENLANPPPRPRARPSPIRRRFARYAVAAEDFNEKIVGGKSCHQARLRGRLPDWIHLPASVALPFGVFEKVLGLHLNQDAAKRYHDTVQALEGGEAEKLAALREIVLSLVAPEELREALQAVMDRSGLVWPADWEPAWTCIKRVWASKWNERAFLSRQRMDLPHADLFMAVLVQQVVPAEYAFVVHTVNPSTGNARELLAEVVLGLGETLVGNFPGRAFSFSWDKTTAQATALSYPSKSTGLYGAGLIFRSDSNGEDLAGYAGAGLYDSVLLEPPRPVVLDYTQEPLVWDDAFRQNLQGQIARAGLEIERVLGSAQDIEGAVAQGQIHVVQTRPQVGTEA